MDSNNLELDDSNKRVAGATVTANMLALRGQAVLDLHYPVRVDGVDVEMCAECGKQSPCPSVTMLLTGE